MNCHIGKIFRNMQVNFDDKFKANKLILSISSRENGIIGWMVKYVILRKPTVILKIHKTPRLHKKNYIQAWCTVSGHES